MFSLKLTRYPNIAHLPGNPMYLRSVEGFRVELRGPALRLLDQVLVAFALSIAVGLVVWKLWALPGAGSLTWSDLAVLGALLFAVTTLWRFAHIATLNVNLLPIGVPLSREVGKEEIVGERDSINLQMIARLYRAPLTLWFTLVALILIASGLFLPPNESGHKRMVLLWAAAAKASAARIEET